MSYLILVIPCLLWHNILPYLKIFLDNIMTIFLETSRLILKTHEEKDLAYVAKLRSNLDVMKYIGDGTTHTEVQVQHFLDITLPYQQKHNLGFCAVFEKSTGNFIGQAGLFHLGYDDTQSDIEIAYRLSPSYWNKGYATELVKALIQWGFEHLNVDKLIAVTHPNNTASQKVLTKSGLDFCGIRTWYTGAEVCWYEIYRNDNIELTPYNSDWPALAEKEIKILAALLPQKHIVDIQHVGSTAIPGMIAKPIIDIQIAVDSLEIIKPIAIEILQSLDYQYWQDNPDPERLFFVKGMPPLGEKRTHHVHIVEPTSKHWTGKILFRDYLRAHPAVARDYEQLKINLANKYQHDREAYTEGKSLFLQGILGKVK